MEKEYIVALHQGINYDEFWDEIEKTTHGLPYIPDRSVDIVNNRDVSYRQCHYALSDDEAAELRKDPRVYFVEELPKIPPSLNARQSGIYGEFTKYPPTSVGGYKNWGLLRCINPTNIYAGGNYFTDYTYCLDGTGVDVVILDTGIQANHPEWQDAHGINRLQQINWYTASGLAGTQPAVFYQDLDGHGTHTAAIACGKTFGWARGANIYCMRSNSLAGGTQISPRGLEFPDYFDCITGWHYAKIAAGNMRPTVVNMSFGFRDYWKVNSVSYMNAGTDKHQYRGVSWTGTTPDPQKGMVGATFPSTNTYFGSRLLSVDINIDEMITAGIHVITASGNYYQKGDLPGGSDYNNFSTGSFYYGMDYINYYNRGHSPFSENAIKVGALDTDNIFGGPDGAVDRRATFSGSGPAVDIYAPGVNILSACSNTNAYGASVYNENSSFKQVVLTGTSMASPQAAGVCALLLQMEPTLTPSQLKTRLLSYGIMDRMYTTGSDSDYTNLYSVCGGEPRILYLPYNVDTSVELTNIPITQELSFKMI